MDPFGPYRKKSRSDGFLNGNGLMAGEGDARRFTTGSKAIGGASRSKPAHPIGASQEKELFPTGLGSKSKPCTKFFSTSGCPYGEGCHFLHYVPGGVNAVSQMPTLGNTLSAASRKVVGPTSGLVPPDQAAPVPGYKTRICTRYGTAEGCRFGDNCHFAHGEKELRKGNIPTHELERGHIVGPLGNRPSPGLELDGRSGGRPPHREPAPPGLAAAANFGASSTAKISIDASLTGGIIGKGGVNSKQICRLTGAKLFIKEHESDPKLNNIELEGSFEQIKQATAMVRELIMRNDTLPAKPSGHGPQNRKTKLCEKYAQGTCTFGGSCHFAHGASELREHSLRA